MTSDDFALLCEAAAGLVTIRAHGPELWVHLPLTYPDGTGVACRVQRANDGTWTVDDTGWVAREAGLVNRVRRFHRVVRARQQAVTSDGRIVAESVPADRLAGALMAVANASKDVMTEVYR